MPHIPRPNQSLMRPTPNWHASASSRASTPPMSGMAINIRTQAMRSPLPSEPRDEAGSGHRLSLSEFPLAA